MMPKDELRHTVNYHQQRSARRPAHLAAGHDVYLWMINGLVAVQLVVNYDAIVSCFSNTKLLHNALSNHQHVTHQLHIKHQTENLLKHVTCSITSRQ